VSLITVGYIAVVAMLTLILLGVPIAWSMAIVGVLGELYVTGFTAAASKLSLTLWENGTLFVFIAANTGVLLLLLGGLKTEQVDRVVIAGLHARACKSLARKLGLHCVVHPRNRGYGAALKSGIQAARHPVVVVMDGAAPIPGPPGRSATPTPRASRRS